MHDCDLALRSRSARTLAPLLATLAAVASPALAADDPRAIEAAYMRSQFEQLAPAPDGRVAIAASPAPMQMYLRPADADGDGHLTLAEFTTSQLDPGGAGQHAIPESVTLIEGVAYADTDHPRQQLDIYLPAQRRDGERLPVVAYVHGGAWHMGSRAMARPSVAPLVASGDYAAVSIGYRLTWEATWPAQIHDLKAALRWLRANADAYGFDPDRVCAMGGSAGGHLAAELAATNFDPSVEGRLGSHRKERSDIACAIDLFGATDLTVPQPASRTAMMAGTPSREQLLGAPIERVPGLARQASPLFQVDPKDPPFLIIHGTKDPLVPVDDSKRLAKALTTAGVENYLVLVEGGGHGDFFSPEVDGRIRAFLDRVLRGTNDVVSTKTIVHRPR